MSSQAMFNLAIVLKSVRKLVIMHVLGLALADIPNPSSCRATLPPAYCPPRATAMYASHSVFVVLEVDADAPVPDGDEKNICFLTDLAHLFITSQDNTIDDSILSSLVQLYNHQSLKQQLAMRCALAMQIPLPSKAVSALLNSPRHNSDRDTFTGDTNVQGAAVDILVSNNDISPTAMDLLLIICTTSCNFKPNLNNMNQDVRKAIGTAPIGQLIGWRTCTLKFFCWLGAQLQSRERHCNL